MNEKKWECVETVSGDIYPELLRGLLESNGIPVLLSQEAAGKSAYHFSVGPLSQVQIIVPTAFLTQAKALIDAFFAGELETQTEDDQPEEIDIDQTDQG